MLTYLAQDPSVNNVGALLEGRFLCVQLNLSNAEATFVQSTRKQIFLKTLLKPVMFVFIG